MALVSAAIRGGLGKLSVRASEGLPFRRENRGGWRPGFVLLCLFRMGSGKGNPGTSRHHWQVLLQASLRASWAV